ncbi:chlorophyll a-b binding protein CP26, chloroplastic isoform X4 [Physcomitrium patens]|uniref:chlorophyll a-b binding protein CP26, chloroplastic isoform X4 n=1 Tax=Physcomitrium patens TaxID=3218 RepID=UPI000D175133|nr:chlorophyll a-b binding protein CP26, chloroplastic-like isoform X3 [Physcomitrium patens]|eukprot:XP_024374444.1 chlorophyll a-b binding protein CP26, chloroplastic-like isoform X3 [Physcomitrella patens]
MPGAAGFVLPEAFNKFGAVCGPEAVWRKTGGLLLEGDSIKYFGATIPINLAAAVIAEDLDRLYPGGAFDPLGLANDPE